MKMITTKMMAALTAMTCLLPLTATAAPAKTVLAKTAAVKKTAAAKTTAAATMYECTTCHMKVSAATAKKDHYKDPMDGGTLVPVKPAKK